MSATLMRLDLSAPHTIYKTADGKRCPGVTTVLGVLDKGALLPWAAGLERDSIIDLAGALVDEADARGEIYDTGEALTADLRARLGREYAFEAARDKAADLGTITHARIEAWLNGQELDPEGIAPEQYEASVHGFERFREWWFEAGLTTVATERPLVSERMRVGGTLDVVARDAQGFLVLVDIKTSNATKSWPYPSVIGQVAAYAEIWNEQGGEAIDRIAVARVGKQPGDDGQRLWVSEARRTAGLELFNGALVCYRAQQALGRVER